MLKYNITDDPVGSLGLDADAIDWLANAYIPSKLQTGIHSIVAFERAMRNVAYNPNWHLDATMISTSGGVIDLTLDVVLRPDAWIDPFGRNVWGLFWSPQTGWSRPKVEVAWNPDYNLGYGVMMHELVHMLEYYDRSSPTWWTDWQHSLHGRFSVSSTGKLQDPYLIACNAKVQEGFPLPVNHSYHPGQLPCGGTSQASYVFSDEELMIAKINLYSNGNLEVFGIDAKRIPSFEKPVADCVYELVKNIATTTVLCFVHTETGASAELSKNQFLDRLLMFL